MKRFSLAAILIMMTAISAVAAANGTAAKTLGFPGTLANARYVYVASYDGDQFNPNLIPEDREAISAVQGAIQNWGKLTLVYQRSDADIIILVTSRPSEDILAVYDGHQGTNGTFLWRVMGRDPIRTGIRECSKAQVSCTRTVDSRAQDEVSIDHISVHGVVVFHSH